MKKIQIKLVLLLIAFLFFKSGAYSQIVIHKKPVVICEIKMGGQWMAELDQEDDTIYRFHYQDAQFSQIVSIKSISFNRTELAEFMKALETSENSKIGETITAKDYAIVKDKSLATTTFTIYHNNSYSTLLTKHVKKLIESIAKMN